MRLRRQPNAEKCAPGESFLDKLEASEPEFLERCKIRAQLQAEARGRQESKESTK